MKQESKFAKIKIKEGLFTKRSGEELIVLGPDETSIFILNETGNKIWELIKEGKDIEDIVVCFENEYDIDKDSLKKEIECFLGNIRKYPELLVT